MENKNIYEEYSFKRKQLQSSNEAPEWMHTAGLLLMYQKGYLREAETPRDRYNAIAKKLASFVEDKLPISRENMGYNTWEEAFFQMMWKGWVSLSTPALSNIGRLDSSAHGVACSGVSLEDSVESFYEKRKENALLAKHGYGGSWCLDNVSPRGTMQDSGVKATGVTMPMNGAVQDMADVSQGSRRGSIGQYINVLHPDFREVVERLNADNHGLNIGWNITDQFIEMFDRDYDLAQDIFATTLQTKMRTGKGYYLFLDKVNENKPRMYADRGHSVTFSNLCVTGDTKLLTENGYVPIESASGTNQTIWDGKEWVEVPVFKTSEGQKVMTVVLDNGVTIEATPYHRWLVKSKGKHEDKIVETRNLKYDDTLVDFELSPIKHGIKELEFAYSNGFNSSIGTFCLENRGSYISLNDNQKKLLERLNGYSNSSYDEDDEVLKLEYDKGILQGKFFVPDSSYSLESKLEWLEGYFDGNGKVAMNNSSSESMQIISIDRIFMMDVALLLQELGVYSEVKKHGDVGYSTSIGGNRFWNATRYRLLISGSQSQKLLDLGYKASIVQPTRKTYDRDNTKHVRILNLLDEGKVKPTYCVTNKKNDTMMINGVQTMNCSEVTLFADQDHSFTCVLSSMNVSKYDEWKDTKAVTIATVMLDCIIEDMLEKSRDKDYFDKVVRFTENTRAIGLGQMGLFTYLQEKLLVVGSVEAMAVNYEVVDKLEKETFKASQWLAKELGEPEYLKGYGHRFSHTLAFAPTKSTALIMGGINEGINPYFANVFMQDTAGSSFMRVNPILLDLMKAKGVYNKDNLDAIIKDNGSVQQVDWLSDYEKAVFRTAFETNQETLLAMNSERQKIMSRNKMGQSQSFNFFFQKEATEDYIASLHKKAFLDPWCFSLYYAYSLTEPSVYLADAVCEGCNG